MYASYDHKPNDTNYQYKSDSNSIIIKPSDKEFKRDGNLIVAVKPHFTFMNILKPNYKYTIVYSS